MAHDRRTFLKRTGAALSVAAAGGCAPEGSSGTGTGADGAGLDPALLRALAPLVLPSELGDEGREQAVQAFEAWAAAYEPVPELNHGYGTAEIRYGPADPVPAWGAQLRALDLEASKRHGQGFASLAAEVRLEVLRRHVDNEGVAMPDALRARHVAVALMAHWFATPEATDRCYGFRITPRTCRGIADAPAEPEPLP